LSIINRCQVAFALQSKVAAIVVAVVVVGVVVAVAAQLLHVCSIVCDSFHSLERMWTSSGHSLPLSLSQLLYNFK